MLKSILTPDNYFFNPHSLVYFISGILIAAESAFIFFQNRKSILNFSFSLCTIFAGIWLTGVGFIYSSASEPVALVWSRYYSWLGITFVTPAVYLLSEAWRGPELKRKAIIYFNFITAFVIYLICISTPYIVQGMWHYRWGLYPRAGRGELPFILWFYLLMSLSFHNFILSFREEKIAIKKQQTKFVIIAFVFGFLGSLDYVANFGIPFYTFAAVSVLLFSTTVAYNIIRYRLMEIETVIHKTIAWFLTSVALVAPLAILLFFTRGLYIRLSSSGAWAYLGIVLLSFLFFVKSFQPKVDHFFRRRRADLEAISERFSEELVHLRELSQLIQRLKDTIANTLYPQQVEIFIYSQEKTSPFLQWLAKNNKIVYREFIDIDPRYAPVREEAGNYFNSSGAILVIPLALNEKLLGLINLGKKANLKRYNAAEFHFLTILKNQATIAISNSLLYENMEEQVRQRTKELMEVQQQLIQAEKLATMGTLAGGVAHEINNPLTAILANVQMLLATQEVDAKLDRESLELIEEATKRCRNIVQKLMSYAKKPVESAKMSEVNLARVIRTVVGFLGYQLGQENIKLEVEAKEEDYPVRGDANELEQVVTNITLNAKDAIRRLKNSGQIKVSLSKDSEWVKIKIRDDGAGIPKEIMPKIFDPFFTTKDVGKGLGLGLSICQAIIEKHNGLIKVQSEVNKGSVFTIQLPKAKVESAV